MIEYQSLEQTRLKDSCSNTDSEPIVTFETHINGAETIFITFVYRPFFQINPVELFYRHCNCCFFDNYKSLVLEMYVWLYSVLK